MKDLTQGPITRHLVAMAVPIAIGMLFQTLYLLVDLYFVSRLGDAAIAGVSTAGTVSFVILALTQMLGVGTVALISHAVGRKDQPRANLVFNQAVLLSGDLRRWSRSRPASLLSGPYVRALAADAAARAAGTAYLYWFTPGLALQFALVAMGSALRGTGIVKPTMLVQMLTVLAERHPRAGPDRRLGHRPSAGHRAARGWPAASRSAFGVMLLCVYFARLEHYVGFDAELWAPALAAVIRRILNVGLPAGGEFAMMFLITGGDLLGDPRLRAAGAGRLRHRLARDAGAVPAGRWRWRSRWRRSPGRTSARATTTACARRFDSAAVAELRCSCSR